MRIGFVVNPIAGAGGKVGLKGSDNVEEALKSGGTPVAPSKAAEFCKYLDAEIITCSSSMRADYIDGKIIYKTPKKTTADDTIKACSKFLKYGVDLIIFVGGDGTARDVYNAVGKKVPILGIPAGVKMYSGVFAINVNKAIEIVNAFKEGKAEKVEREIMDIDEAAFRKDLLKIKLFGYALCPAIKNFLQNGKRIFRGENEAKKEIARFMALICKEGTYILGPGSTVKAIADEMGIEKTLLGVDVIENGKIIARDANEMQILKAIKGKRARIIVSPIGGEGFIFGRGNQQISSRVIEKVGVENIIVVATPQKLMQTPFLYVDTGDRFLDKKFAGWISVIAGFGIAIRKRIVI
jgi:predicted polyphosphate/ATP-dependent NAD kinase